MQRKCCRRPCAGCGRMSPGTAPIPTATDGWPSRPERFRFTRPGMTSRALCESPTAHCARRGSWRTGPHPGFHHAEADCAGQTARRDGRCSYLSPLPPVKPTREQTERRTVQHSLKVSNTRLGLVLEAKGGLLSLLSPFPPGPGVCQDYPKEHEGDEVRPVVLDNVFHGPTGRGLRVEGHVQSAALTGRKPCVARGRGKNPQRFWRRDPVSMPPF